MLKLRIPKVPIDVFSPNSKSTLVQAPKLPPISRWEYDVFIDETVNDNVVHVDITQDQKSAHVRLLDGSERDIILPSGYDHISLFREHDVQVNVIQSESDIHISGIDVFLFVIQLAFLARFASVDWATKMKAREERDNKLQADSIQQSGKIITEVLVDSECQQSNCTGMDIMRNNLMMSISGVVAEDIAAGVMSSSTAPTSSISHILRIGYQIVLNYEILETPEQINRFVLQTYRQCRIMLKRNIKYVKRVQEAILKSNKPLDTEQIRRLTEGISCDISQKPTQ